ncbi:MAG: EAL domain-containing protein [Roseiarcus sp.]
MESPVHPIVEDDVRPGRPNAVTRRSSRSRNRFIVIGVTLILAIAVGDGLVVSMAREAALASRAATNTLLDKSMIAQASRKLGAVDKVLRDMPAALGAGDVANDGLMNARLRAPTTSEFLAERRKRLQGVEALTIVDAEGRIANSAGDGASTGTDLSGSQFFGWLKAHAEATPFVGAPERDSISGEWSNILARRMTDAHGNFIGVVLARLSLDELADFYGVAMPLHRTLTVMRNDGTVLVQYPGGTERTGRMVARLASHAPAGAGCSTYQGPDLVDGAAVVAAVCPMDDLPLMLQASATQEEALEGWNRQRPWLLLGGALAAVVVMGLLRLFAAQVRRLELSELSLAAEKNEANTAHSQLDGALSNIPQGVCFFDADQRLIVSNRRYLEIYGLAPEAARPGLALAELADLCWKASRISNYERAEYLTSLMAMARAVEPRQLILELESGRTISIQSQPMPDGGWVATHEDITERRRAEDRIAYLAKHDPLTGLPNRSLLQEQVQQALSHRTSGGQFAVLFLDLDRFKAVNDTLGHGIGDKLLRQVAARLSDVVSGCGTVARLGGDEFVVLQGGVRGPEDVARLARRIVDAIAAPYTIEGHEIVIGVSIGVDMAGEADSTAEVLLKNADTALYSVKAQGRGDFRFFEPTMDLQLRSRHQLELDLRHALADRQFELHYQPIVDAASGRVCAFEALLRWNHPDRGLIMPGDFVGAAEESGLIIPIGEWVIQQACRQAAQWPEEIGIAVNLSPVQFRAASLVPTILDALAATGLAARRLELEITESVLLHNDRRNLAILHELRALGAGVVMDDFGIGYSSMSYLRQFPFSKIKIDRSFINDLTYRTEAVYFVRAIVDLCRNLKITTTAEGVESIEQLSILLHEGCGELQGYLLGRPMLAACTEGQIDSGRLIPSRKIDYSEPSRPGRVQAGARF